MKRSNYIRQICAALSVVMLTASLYGCQENRETAPVQEPLPQVEAMETEEVPSVYFDSLGGKDVMPIGGYYVPLTSEYSKNGQSLPDYNTDEYFEKMAGCGVNLLVAYNVDYQAAPQVISKSLDLAAKYGMVITVHDTGISEKRGENVPTLDEAVTELSNYMTHPGFGGLFLCDEPRTSYYFPTDGTRDISQYAPLSNLLKEDVGIFCYSNMLGCRAGMEEGYERYIQEYCEKMNPEYLCFDKYVWDTTVSVENYIYNLATVREYAEKYNIPFWSFVQAGSQWNDAKDYFDSEGYYPNEKEFDWAVNVPLAFGCKGILYFTMIQPYYFAFAKSTEFDFERNGLLGAYGNKNRWYYYAQNMNAQIAAVDEVLMNAVNKGVLVSGQRTEKDMENARNAILEGKSWRELTSFSGDALVGCFNYQGKTALYVVNYSSEYAQKIELNFDGSYRVRVIQDTETRYESGNNLILDMAAGSGALVVFD